MRLPWIAGLPDVRRGSIVALMLTALAGCANWQAADLATMCRFYVTVKSIVEVASWLHPAISAGTKAITKATDPLCEPILAGEPAPAGVDAVLITQRIVALEELEEGVR